MFTVVKLPMRGSLKYVNAYYIESEGEAILIDSGFPFQETFDLMKKFMKDRRKPDRVVITHYHPDHLGLVKFFKGSKILIHEREKEFIDFIMSEKFEKFLFSFLSSNDIPREILFSILRGRDLIRDSISGVKLETLKEGDIIKVGETRLEVIWTPGHTPGHICLLDSQEKIAFCGDHILPNITPNISVLSPDSNPLKDYLYSLNKVRELNPKIIYPSHGEPINNVNIRIDEIIRHHEERLNEIYDIISYNEKLTAFEVAKRIKWYKSWDELSIVDKQLAVGETISHLVYLERQGKIKKALDVGGKYFYHI